MHTSLLRLWISLFFLIFNQFVSSQAKVDFISMNYSYIAKSNFKDKNGAISMNFFDVNFITPTIKFGAKTKVNNILYYRNSSYNFDDFFVENVDFPNKFHEIKYTILARHTFTSNWELFFIPRFSIRSDFEESLTNKDFFPAVSTIMMKTSQKNDKIKWGIGVGYNNDLGKNSVIPILAINYLSDKMKLNAFFPNNANLTFTPLKKIEYGFAFTTDAALVHVNTLDSVDYVRTLNVHINPTFSYHLGANFWLNGKAGVVIQRQFDLYNANFEASSDDFENKLKPAGFFQIGLSLRAKSEK
jgi:hypothetical protein